MVTPGYFENPAANAQAFDSDGWFKTGDICYCDETTHKWYIVDRKKELIKVRGFQVSPSELEAVLLSHPQIIDTAIIGIKFPRSREELPRAYVVRRPGNDGRNLTENEVKQFLLGRLAKYKALEGGVQFIDAIPKNASGKILKRVLREQANKDIESGAIKPKL
jgi:acyl-CoA synthetase (AMP-forming)/AMP-acid ligase II